MTDLHVDPVTAEHHREPLGIGEAAPRLSWVTRTDRPGWSQRAYEIEVTDADSGTTVTTGRVDSIESVLVPWPVTPLTDRERRSVRVRVWGRGESIPSGWSEPTALEVGLLDPDEWCAVMVGPVLPAPGTDGEPAALLRREVRIAGQVGRARLLATAHGVLQVHLNGHIVGDDVLAPGWTSYHHRLRYRTYDVTDLILDGANTLGVQLADGWYRGYLGFAGLRDVYGDRTARSSSWRSTTRTGPEPCWAPTGRGAARSARSPGPTCTAARPSTPEGNSPAGTPTGSTTPGGIRSTCCRRAATGWWRRPGRRSGARRPCGRWRSPHRPPVPPWSTSGRTSSAGCSWTSRRRRPAPRSPSGTPRSSNTASWAPDRCVRRRRPTGSSWTAPAHGPGSRCSPCTGSGTSRWTAGPVSSPSTTCGPWSSTPTCAAPAPSAARIRC